MLIDTIILQLFYQAQPSAINGVIALYMQLDSHITPRL